jgi:3-oxoadipate enol-lactonase
VKLFEQRMGLGGEGEDGAPPPGLTYQLQARAGHDTSSRLSAIACPTFVCAGRFDGIAPPANSEFLAQHISGARLGMFDGGHGFFLQDPAAMPAIIAFLSEDAAAVGAP